MSDRGRLVLQRRSGQAIMVGDVLVRVHEISGNKVRLLIEAPRGIPIDREEVRAKIEREQLVIAAGEALAARPRVSDLAAEQESLLARMRQR